MSQWDAKREEEYKCFWVSHKQQLFLKGTKFLNEEKKGGEKKLLLIGYFRAHTKMKSFRAYYVNSLQKIIYMYKLCLV